MPWLPKWINENRPQGLVSNLPEFSQPVQPEILLKPDAAKWLSDAIEKLSHNSHSHKHAKHVALLQMKIQSRHYGDVLRELEKMVAEHYWSADKFSEMIDGHADNHRFSFMEATILKLFYEKFASTTQGFQPSELAVSVLDKLFSDDFKKKYVTAIESFESPHTDNASMKIDFHVVRPTITVSI